MANTQLDFNPAFEGGLETFENDISSVNPESLREPMDIHLSNQNYGMPYVQVERSFGLVDDNTLDFPPFAHLLQGDAIDFGTAPQGFGAAIDDNRAYQDYSLQTLPYHPQQELRFLQVGVDVFPCFTCKRLFDGAQEFITHSCTTSSLNSFPPPPAIEAAQKPGFYCTVSDCERAHGHARPFKRRDNARNHIKHVHKLEKVEPEFV